MGVHLHRSKDTFLPPLSTLLTRTLWGVAPLSVSSIKKSGTKYMVRIGGGWQDLDSYLSEARAKFFHRSVDDAKVQWSMSHEDKYKGEGGSLAAEAAARKKH